MGNLVIQLPAYADQHGFNLRRWEEISADPFYANFEQPIETDRHGQIIVKQIPELSHSYKGSTLIQLLNQHLPGGHAQHEVPISTLDGVRATNVAWLTAAQLASAKKCDVLLFAPKICVEVLSPSTTEREMQERAALYFAAGATEVWLCDLDGYLRFFSAPGEKIPRSCLAPNFPTDLGTHDIRSSPHAAIPQPMSTLSIQLPAQETQTEFNIRRWEELVDDPFYANFEQRIETDRHGHIIMSPPPFFNHGIREFNLAKLLEKHLPDGTASVEVPVSTTDGVRAADAAWISAERLSSAERTTVLPLAPEICVEVLSPSNTERQMQEKAALYFDAGAKEVWLCDLDGSLRFFSAPGEQIPVSRLAPDFPQSI